MKHILYSLLLTVLLFSCSKDDDFVYDNSIDAGNIKLLELRSDHTTLIADGKAMMRFYPKAYNILEFPNYTPTYVEDSALYIPGMSRDTSIIPQDQIPSGMIKLYDDKGKEYSDFTFTTDSDTPQKVKFHLEAGELLSNEVEITLLPKETEEYEEIVMPVIFHVMTFQAAAGVAPIYITPEVIYKNIERLNDVFGGKVTTDPNGVDTKIVFKPAEYDTKGMKLENPGIHKYEIPSSVTLNTSAEFQDYVYSKGGELMYDYRNFLNIWLINNPKGSSSIVNLPNMVYLSANAIPGLPANLYTTKFPEQPTDIGFFVSMSYFLNPGQQADYFEISSAMAQYLGLLSPEVRESMGTTNLVDGDTDYCEDTYYWYNDNGSVYKNNGKVGAPASSLTYFTSYHVMDRYSFKNSITRCQAKRIREVLAKYPSRMMYKSKFAFTGDKNDKL